MGLLTSWREVRAEPGRVVAPDERLPWPQTAAMGVQHVIAMFGATVLAPILMGFNPNLAILMRHRAVLFGILGLFFVFAAFRPEIQTVAFLAGFVSVVSFLWLAWSVGGYGPQVARVVMADIIALVCLMIGAAAHAYAHGRG